jgi:HlyD family secretion protein
MTEVDLRGLAIDRSDNDPGMARGRRNVVTRYVLPLLLVLGFMALIAWALRDFLLPPKPVTVVPIHSTTAEVRQEGAALFKAAGWIEPRPTPVRVAALAPGVVDTLLVVEDQPVKVGDAIAELVKDDAVLTHQRTLADLELRQAELEEVQAVLQAAETRFKQPVHLEAALSAAEASLAKIDTEIKNLPFVLQRAESDYKAMKLDFQGKTSARGVIAEIEIDIAESKVDAANALVQELSDRDLSLLREQAALAARRDALKTQLELLADETRAVNEAKAQIKAAAARVSQTTVDVAEAKLRLDRMTIVAPVDGRVFRLIAHPGARIGAGMTQMEGHDGSTVITMYRPKMLQIRVDTRFEDIPKVSLGQSVTIDNPALSSPLLGKVLFISSEADIQKNTLQVKVEIPDPPDVFKPEMLVDVTFLAPKPLVTSGQPSEEIKLYAPEELLHRDDGGTFAWIADQSLGIARKTYVETGVTAGGLVEITNGLSVTSRIIDDGSTDLRDGQRIQVTEQEAIFGKTKSSSTVSSEDSPSGGNE